MIFAPDLARKVMRGEKTQTRRRRTDEPCRYVVGRTYAVQPQRGAPELGRILILGVTEQELCDITPSDAIEEGFESVGEFFDRWEQMYEIVRPRDLVWRIEFEVVAPTTSDPAAAVGGPCDTHPIRSWRP